MRMTIPKGIDALTPATVTLGEPIGRSWILLFGVLPIDYDDITLVELEDGHRNNRPVSRPPFGTVENPVRVLIREHDSAGENLKKIRETTGDYVTPPDACTSYQALYRTLRALEEDLHYHIYLENHVLFPRALEMEEAAGRAKGAPGRG